MKTAKKCITENKTDHRFLNINSLSPASWRQKFNSNLIDFFGKNHWYFFSSEGGEIERGGGEKGVSSPNEVIDSMK